MRPWYPSPEIAPRGPQLPGAVCACTWRCVSRRQFASGVVCACARVLCCLIHQWNYSVSGSSSSSLTHTHTHSHCSSATCGGRYRRETKGWDKFIGQLAASQWFIRVFIPLMCLYLSFSSLSRVSPSSFSPSRTFTLKSVYVCIWIERVHHNKHWHYTALYFPTLRQLRGIDLPTFKGFISF